MIRCRCVVRSSVAPICKPIKVSSSVRCYTQAATETAFKHPYEQQQTTQRAPSKRNLAMEAYNEMKSIELQMKKSKLKSNLIQAIQKFERYKKSHPDTFSYDMWLNALECYAETGQLSKMRAIYEDICKRKREPYIYNTAIKAFGKHGQLDQAARIFQEMKDHAILPNKFTYALLMVMYATAKKKEQALFYFEKLRDLPKDNDTSMKPFTMILKYFANEGDIENMKHYYDMMLKDIGKEDAFVFGTMLQGFDKAGDMGGMMAYYQSVKSKPDAHICLNVITMQMLMEILAKHDMKLFTEFYPQESSRVAQVAALAILVKQTTNLQTAMKHFEDFLNLGCIPLKTTYNYLLSLASKQRDLDALNKLWNSMQQHNVRRDSYSYNAFISYYVANNNIPKAVAYFVEMKEKRIQPDTVTFNKMMQVFGNQNQYEEVLELWDHMQQLALKPDTLSFKQILQCLRALGGIDRIHQVAQQMKAMKIPAPDSPVRLAIMTTLLDAYSIHGTVEDMLTQYQEMEAAGITFHRTMYHPILYRFSKEGDTDAMLSYLELMLQAPGTPDQYPTIFQHFIREGTIPHIYQFYSTWIHMGVPWLPWMWDALIQKLLSLREAWTKEHCQSFCKVVAAELHGTGGADMEALIASLLNSTTSQPAGASLSHLQGVQFYHLLLAVQATILQRESSETDQAVIS